MRQSRFAVVGLLLVALANVVREAPRVLAGTGSTEDLMMTGWLVVMACCIAFVGIDVARDGRHFEITPDADRVLSP